MKKYIYILLAVIFLIPNFINKDINEPFVYDKKEKYDPQMDTINSVNKLEAYADNKAAQNNYKTQSLQYVNELSTALENRFYHGFSHFSLKENWMAAIGEKLFGYGLASKVDIEEIMKHDKAACSQQSMVLMEILRRKGITYRKVGFPHHFATEVNIDSNWYYIDTNMEPAMTNEQRLESSWNLQNDSLKKYYHIQPKKIIDYAFGNNVTAVVDPPNQQYAKNALLFQKVSGIASKILWLFPLLLFYYNRRRAKK